MSGIADIQVLLKEMSPVLDKTEYVFSTNDIPATGYYNDHIFVPAGKTNSALNILKGLAK